MIKTSFLNLFEVNSLLVINVLKQNVSFGVAHGHHGPVVGRVQRVAALVHVVEGLHDLASNRREALGRLLVGAARDQQVLTRHESQRIYCWVKSAAVVPVNCEQGLFMGSQVKKFDALTQGAAPNRYIVRVVLLHVYGVAADLNHWDRQRALLLSNIPELGLSVP